ncbi:MAG: ArsA family ATPase [Solirubrobacteraceae bacterium]
MNVVGMLEGKRVCICGGSGGVGKTTTAAAIAMGMAAQGGKVAVVTIDPAKRLAASLGLEELDNDPRLVDPAVFTERGMEFKGELWAMMLDSKRTFDELIARLAPSESARDEVLANRIYQELSSAVAGSQEFTAIAKLYELDREGDYDLLVLDTPPSRNALDFLDAPDRLTSFFEGRALQVFLKPTGLGMRLFGRGTGVVFAVLKRVTGIDLLQDLSVFFRSLGGMIEGFKERATAVNELLCDRGTTFLLITSPEREPIEEATFFWRKLKAARMPFGGVIVNRVHHDYELGELDVAQVASELEPELGPKLAGRVAENLSDYHVLAKRDRENIAQLAHRLGGEKRMILVPYLDSDVHDVDGLRAIHRYLWATESERTAMLADVVA